MPATLAFQVLLGFIYATRRRVRETAVSDAGATTLELVIIVLGLIALAVAAVAAITVAVNRRLEQIN